MKKTLLLGLERLEILDVGESVLTFKDLPAARAFLRTFQNQADQIAILCRTLQHELSTAQWLSVEDVLERLAALLVNGKIRLLKSPRLLPRGDGAGVDSAEKSKPAQQNAPSRAQKKKDWIEIHLKDTNGRPVPGERFLLKLPDASVEEGRLDAFGYVEYYGINPGNCDISFPDIDGNEWRRV